MKEIWKDIEGYDGRYQVSNLGYVRRVHIYRYSEPFKVLAIRKARNGYLRVGLCNNSKVKFVSIHRLVAETFIPNPNNYSCVNHIDGNKENNRCDNLEWCTHSYNNKEAYRLGLAKISKQKIERMRILGLNSGKKVIQKDFDNNIINIFNSTCEASRKTGICQTSISAYCRGKIKKTGKYIWEYLEKER